MKEAQQHGNRKTVFINHPERHHALMLGKLGELKQEYNQSQTRKRRRKTDLSRPVACWSEKELLHGEPVSAFVIILRSQGCRWYKSSGCTMCGYFEDTTTVTVEELKEQIAQARERYQGQPMVKLFSSGSFFDEQDLPQEARRFFLDSFAGSAEKLIIESRPELVTEDALRILDDVGCRVEVALGLESSNDHLLQYTINKGFRFRHYVKAATLLCERELGVKTYLLLKPPYLTEQEAIRDAVDSIRDVLPYTNTISINPVNVQNFTYLRFLWHKGLYRPPRFWSLLEVLEQGHLLARETGVRLMSSPSGAGTKRGVHNCGLCDGRMKEAVERYSMTGELSHLQEVDCRCRELWKDGLEAGEILRDDVPGH